MKICRLKVNGIKNPIGFSFDSVCCAWVVTDTEAKKTDYVKIDVATDEHFTDILVSKEGEN